MNLTSQQASDGLSLLWALRPVVVLRLYPANNSGQLKLGSADSASQSLSIPADGLSI